jgi:hypothetical protein
MCRDWQYNVDCKSVKTKEWAEVLDVEDSGAELHGPVVLLRRIWKVPCSSLSWLMAFVVFPRHYIKGGHGHFLPLQFQFIIRWHSAAL